MAAFLLYACLLAVGVYHHEPWFDEAQAWLLSRDSRPLDLINTYLRYEGTPGLWHFILGLAAKTGLPYTAMSIIAALFALLGVLLFLLYAPFPWPVKLLFPFSYFVLYQYAVVARSYVLLPCLLFGIAMLYPKRQEKFYGYVLLLGLLANVSLHGLIMAFCFASIDLLTFVKARSSLNPAQRNQLILGFSLLLGLGLLAVWQIRFPMDHSAVHPRRSYDLGFALDFTFQFISRALTEQKVLSGLVLGLSLWHFWKTGTLSLFLWPVLIMGHLFAFVYASVWHEGILFLLWIYCLWISFEKSTPVVITRPYTLATICVVLGIHISWAVTAFRNDLKNNYSAAEQVAEYLKTRRASSPSIYATGFHSIAILPYFDHNIFANYDHHQDGAFWDWSLKNDMQHNLDLIVLDAPDTIVHGIKTRFSMTAQRLPGYIATKFTGHIYWKDRTLEEDSYVVYEKINMLGQR
ncbi:MAG TPA: hypothetical protein VE954_21910 [Oligoflexus sp.]|nr:hypothetical protein [Oligoflexus sp.]